MEEITITIKDKAHEVQFSIDLRARTYACKVEPPVNAMQMYAAPKDSALGIACEFGQSLIAHKDMRPGHKTIF